MQISITDEGWLDWEADQVSLVREHARPGPLIVPEVVVIHYGVTRNLPDLVRAQRANGYFAHLSIDGYAHKGARYLLHQLLPFNERGSHAGPSSYRGRDKVNGFSIGIEIANPGPLRMRNGKLFTTWGLDWPDDEAIQARHKNGSPWERWATYTDQEIDILVGVIQALKIAYPSIRDVVGHDEIAPGRKSDPGPAFPMVWLREKLFPKVSEP